MNDLKLISIVLPCYNEEQNIDLMYSKLTEVVDKIPNYSFEFIFIDNCSKDKTVDKIESLVLKDGRVKAIINMNNFGAIRSPYYGLINAKGDAAILMATDLQDPPELIPQFIQQWENGYKVVAGTKASSNEIGIMHFIRVMYYKLMKKISKAEQIEHFTGFGLYDYRVVNVLKTLDDPFPYLRGIIAELGFKVATINFHKPNRSGGESSYKFTDYFDYAILGITTQSKLPLRILTIGGFILSVFSFLLSIIFVLLKLFMWNRFPVGIAPILCGLFFFSSVQLFFIGMLGEYVLLIYAKVANRPLVVEERRINF